MLRRSVTLGLILGLTALVPVPLSVCALQAGLPANCPICGSHADCDTMRAATAGTKVESPVDRSCCHVAVEPLPEAQSKAPTSATAILPARTAAPLELAPLARHFFPRDLSPNLSPPDLQPLLCVFLI